MSEAVRATYELDGRTYAITSDVHTHTVYSHGTGSIEDNVKAARAIGLKRIGIADHGPAHVGFGVKRKRLPMMHREIERLRSAFPDIEILLGIEANIINTDGTLDIHPEDFGFFDYLLAGYHYGAIGNDLFQSLGRNIANFMTPPQRASRDMIERNTRDIVAALRNNDIYAITHPGDKSPVDLIELAAVCAETNTLVELNTSHRSLSAKDIMDMSIANVGFLISSDAHSPSRVGDFRSAVDLILEAGIDVSKVANLKVEC
ncbi:MAG: PHP domain-containing protein [Clostridiales Family XIII bacterium]|nr:PHP domain-containing protein [Clostridiales Family XIII bacterium]